MMKLCVSEEPSYTLPCRGLNTQHVTANNEAAISLGKGTVSLHSDHTLYSILPGQ